jgi:hypothetical protein
MAEDFLEPEADFDGSIVPTDDDGWSPSEELDDLEERLDDPALFGDAVQSDALVLDTEPRVYTLGRSWLFDFSQSRFVTDRSRARSPIGVTGIPQLQNWVEKALYTPRGALPIHPDDYGLENPDSLVGGPFTAASAASLRRRIEECVTFHPKIIGIEGFSATPTPDDAEGVDVRFTIHLDNDDVIPFSTRLQ